MEPVAERQLNHQQENRDHLVVVECRHQQLEVEHPAAVAHLFLGVAAEHLAVAVVAAHLRSSTRERQERPEVISETLHHYTMNEGLKTTIFEIDILLVFEKFTAPLKTIFVCMGNNTTFFVIQNNVIM